MGLITLPIPGGQVQYFSFSEEILMIGKSVLKFVLNISPAWLIVITAISLLFIAGGVLYKMQTQIEGLQ